MRRKWTVRTGSEPTRRSADAQDSAPADWFAEYQHDLPARPHVALRCGQGLELRIAGQARRRDRIGREEHGGGGFVALPPVLGEFDRPRSGIDAADFDAVEDLNSEAPVDLGEDERQLPEAAVHEPPAAVEDRPARHEHGRERGARRVERHRAAFRDWHALEDLGAIGVQIVSDQRVRTAGDPAFGSRGTEDLERPLPRRSTRPRGRCRGASGAPARDPPGNQ